MKKSIYNVTALIVAAGLLASSCATNEKFVIEGRPGTRIYSPAMPQNPRATIPESGRLEMQISSDTYYGFMLSQAPGSERQVPFGLDVRKNAHTVTKITEGTAYTIASIGIGACLIGTIAMLAANANEDEESTTDFGILAGVGGGVAGVGAAIGAVAGGRRSQTAYEWQFSYQKNQHTNDDMTFAALRNPDLPKGFTSEPEPEKPKRAKASSGNSSKPESKSASVGSKAKRSINDFGLKIEGEYTAKGKLTLGGQTIEQYTDMAIILKRVDKSQVRVVVKVEGEEFFEKNYLYNIKRLKSGNYSLVMEGEPKATITITPAGKLTYLHKAVNLDDELYTLQADGEKDS